MTINKDLVEAIMMLAFISLVLVGTSDFNSEITKDITMATLGTIAVGMIILRIIKANRSEKTSSQEET